MTTLIEVEGLKKYFPVFAGIFRKQINSVKAVDDVSFSIKPGEVVGLVGESGCGKSTIGRAIVGLLAPTAGQIKFCGQDMATMSRKEQRQRSKEMQIVFQDPYASLNPRKTVADNIGEALLFHRLVANKAECNARVLEILKLVELPPEALNRYPHEFSGGQQQRICIGRALALEPKLLICDEAVSALDVSIQAQILNLLMRLKETLNLSYLFISHDLSVVRHICDRVIVLYLGKIAESAPTQELFANPKHPYTQVLLSAIPKSHPKEVSQRIPLKGEVPSPLSPPAGCPFHTRCPVAQPQCAHMYPPRKVVGKGTTSKHHYYCIWD